MWRAVGFLAFVLFASVSGRPDEYKPSKSPSDLRRDIFKNYDPYVLPVSVQGEQIPVNVSFVPLFIRNLDEEKEIVEIDGWLQMLWQDKNLVWDPQSYSGIEVLNIPSDTVWRPDISEYTASPNTGLFPHPLTNVLLYNTGKILWVPPITVNSRCPLDLTRFPKDTQTCKIKFGSWTFGSKSIDLQLYDESVSLDNFYDNNPEWSLQRATVHREDKIYPCCPDESYPSISYNVTLKRKCPGNIYVADTVSGFAVVIGLIMFLMPADATLKLVMGALAEVLLGIVAMYLAIVVKAPAAKFAAGETVYSYMAVVLLFILIEAVIVNIGRMGCSRRPPKWLLSVCKPYSVCSGKNSNEKVPPTAREEWYVVATCLDRLLLFIAVGMSIFIYKIR